jgi:hypothetical protein
MGFAVKKITHIVFVLFLFASVAQGAEIFYGNIKSGTIFTGGAINLTSIIDSRSSSFFQRLKIRTDTEYFFLDFLLTLVFFLFF